MAESFHTPARPLECREYALAALGRDKVDTAIAWALLSIAGDLAELRRDLHTLSRKR